MKHLYGIWIAFLVVSQFGVNATIDVINILNHFVASFSNRDATIMDASTLINGYVEYANPPDACSHIALPKFKPTKTMKNIVLINGTSACNFMTKIQFAKEVGYEAAVLFDPFPGPFMPFIPGTTDMKFPFPRSEINISVVLVSCEDGIRIRNDYVYPRSSDWQNVYLTIFPTIWRAYTMYIFLGAVGLFVVGFVCVVLVAVFRIIREKCINRFGSQNEVETNVQRTLQINENEVNLRSALRNLRRRHPSIVFSIETPFEVCTICLCHFNIKERLRVLGCSHAYHADCIDAWLLHKGEKRTCPLCVDDVNLENSFEQSHCNASESTPLLNTIAGTGGSGGPSSALGAAYNNPIRTTVESSNLSVGVQGSVNSLHLHDSGNEDKQTLIV